MRLLRSITLACAALGSTSALATTLDLYVDTVSKQVYTEPGPNRVSLGTLQKVDPNEPAASVAAPAPAPTAVASTAPAARPAQAAPAAAAPAAVTASAEKQWFERLSIRGYTQLRFNHLLDDELDGLSHQADRSVGEDESLFIRRMRLILSGDLNEHMSIYIQPDFAVQPSGSSTTHFVQLRDAYMDYAFDKRKEFRVRVGQSKVPYSFENLQSSQNRLALDRNDATNSCCKDERDLGVFLYWAPEHIRKRFKELVASGLKGSGDYGVAALGVYNGQGANRLERNDGVHVVGRDVVSGVGGQWACVIGGVALFVAVGRFKRADIKAEPVFGYRPRVAVALDHFARIRNTTHGQVAKYALHQRCARGRVDDGLERKTKQYRSGTHYRSATRTLITQ